jgi:hypothetical protein
MLLHYFIKKISILGETYGFPLNPIPLVFGEPIKQYILKNNKHHKGWGHRGNRRLSRQASPFPLFQT